MRDNKIVTYTPFFNDYDALKRLTQNLFELGLSGIFVDGPFPKFPHTSDKSTDGSRELIESFDNTILLDAGVNYIPTKFNMAASKAVENSAEFMLVIGSDEYIEGDIYSLYKNANLDKPINKVPFKEHTDSKWNRPVTELPRLITKPKEIRLKEGEIHWLYFHNGNVIVTTYFPLAEGIVIHHDDSIRPSWRNKQMEKYQDKNHWREQALRKKYRSEILSFPYPPTMSKSGGKYFSCGCIYMGDSWFNVCSKHLEVKRQI